MAYEFLHHLTQAKLPVTVFDHRLIRQIQAYENQALIVTVPLKMGDRVAIEATSIKQVTKITRAGRRVVRKYLKGKKNADASY